MAARGEFRIRNYLAQQSANKKPIEANDPAFQAGIKDLETAAKTGDQAVAADALFYLGVSREAAKDYEGALKATKKGRKSSKTTPLKKSASTPESTVWRPRRPAQQAASNRPTTVHCSRCC